VNRRDFMKFLGLASAAVAAPALASMPAAAAPSVASVGGPAESMMRLSAGAAELTGKFRILSVRLQAVANAVVMVTLEMESVDHAGIECSVEAYAAPAAMLLRPGDFADVTLDLSADDNGKLMHPVKASMRSGDAELSEIRAMSVMERVRDWREYAHGWRE
jgi:hypothetical protein